MKIVKRNHLKFTAMKNILVSNRRKAIAGGLLAALCAIVCMAISVPVMADPRMSSEGSTSEMTEVQQSATGTIAGHEYVDLGLSVKWATCNVGASSPSDYGNYYAWGETTTKLKYISSTCTTWGKSMSDIAGNPQYDVARANWGGSWRLPTKAESKELIENCNWVWTTYNGHNGYKVTSKINGNTIFLPAAGWREASLLSHEFESGCYWSSTPGGDYTYGAYGIGFGRRGSIFMDWYYRFRGRNVRPVTE